MDTDTIYLSINIVLAIICCIIAIHSEKSSKINKVSVGLFYIIFFGYMASIFAAKNNLSIWYYGLIGNAVGIGLVGIRICVQ